MADTVAFELVSPERLLLARAVEMVVVPGSEGYFGVLPGHAPLVSTLKSGVIDVYDGGVISDRIFVGGGFAEVTPERCTVLAERAVPVAAIDRAALDARVKDLKDDLAAAKSDAERAQVEEAIGIADAELEAAS
jgi:F-type H+-transporting ATPase subunit epsilon